MANLKGTGLAGGKNKNPNGEANGNPSTRAGRRENGTRGIPGTRASRLIAPVTELLNGEDVRHLRIRMSFELYEYQVEELDRLDEVSRERNKKGINKSEVVRKALDAYLGLNHT